MANHTITVSNSLNVFGDDPSTKWGTTAHFVMTWGTDKWGYGSEDMPQDVGKFIEPGSVALSSALSEIQVVFVYGNTLSIDSAMTLEKLSDGSGWDIVLPGGVTNGEDRITSSFTSATGASTSYSAVSPPSTTWS